MTAPHVHVHPYIPNTAPSARAQMLQAIGVPDAAALYESIPDELRLHRPLDLPPPLRSEHELRRHLDGLLSRNRHCGEMLSFLGGGCWQHQVPAVCDEIAGRGEFLTAYGAWPYSDHGKFQAIFEYQSLVGELVGMDVVSTPTYDGGCAAGSALLMACRLTGRKKLLVPDTLRPDRLSQLRGFCERVATLELVGHQRDTAAIDLDDLDRKLGNDVAAVYFETPGFFGTIEIAASKIVQAAHQHAAFAIVGVDPSSLGVLRAPGDYGADIVVGELQPLGMHIQAGGGLAGFISCRDNAHVVAELPTFLVSTVPTRDGTGFGFGVSTMERTSYEKRENAADYYGTTQWLWGITAGVYLALMGPQGMTELGIGIMQRSQYAAARLGCVQGVVAPRLASPFFKEFVVDFSGTGRTVEQINAHLLAKGIFGGLPLRAHFPELGESALYCVTEIHTAADIERLAGAIEEAVQ
jgi:glycine dehydrogenase subunit 1